MYQLFLIKTCFLIGIVACLGVWTNNASAYWQEAMPAENKKTKDLIREACNSAASDEARTKAIKSLGKADDWQSLARVLVWVTRTHNVNLRRFHEDDAKAFVQNVNGIQSLPIPEFFLIDELVRINNPGALPYLRRYVKERFSLPVTNLTGESRAAIEASIEKLEATLLAWEPIDTTMTPKVKEENLKVEEGKEDK